jgi:hypothetical protein
MKTGKGERERKKLHQRTNFNFSAVSKMLGCVCHSDTELAVYEWHVIPLCPYTILYIPPPADGCSLLRSPVKPYCLNVISGPIFKFLKPTVIRELGCRTSR